MKKRKNVTKYAEDDGLIDEILKAAAPESLHFIDRVTEITHQIHQIMSEKNISAKHLSELMGKSQPEISKFLSGTHNFTLRTLAHIESILGQNIILTQVGIEVEVRSLREKYVSEALKISNEHKSSPILRLIKPDYNGGNNGSSYKEELISASA